MQNLRDFELKEGQLVLLINPDDIQRKKSWCMATFSKFYDEDPNSFQAKLQTVFYYYPPVKIDGLLTPRVVCQPQLIKLPAKAEKIVVGDAETIIQYFESSPEMKPYAAFFKA